MSTLLRLKRLCVAVSIGLYTCDGPDMMIFTNVFSCEKPGHVILEGYMGCLFHLGAQVWKVSCPVHSMCSVLYTLRKKCYNEAEPPRALGFCHFPLTFHGQPDLWRKSPLKPHYMRFYNLPFPLEPIWQEFCRLIKWLIQESVSWIYPWSTDAFSFSLRLAVRWL